MNDFYSWGLPVGSIARIRIKLHWLLLVFWLWDLHQVLGTKVPQYRSMLLLAWAFGAALLFVSILLHELGHCFAARSQGGYADEVLLWPLGGLAFCDCPKFWRSHLIVAAAGPAVTLAIVLVSYGAFLLADPHVGNFLLAHPTALLCYVQARHVLVEWSLIIFIFNLIPLYPLDGGRIFHSILWGFFSREGGYVWGGQARAGRITLMVSRITAILGIAYGAAIARDPMLVGLFLWALMGAETLRE